MVDVRGIMLQRVWVCVDVKGAGRIMMLFGDNVWSPRI